MLDDQTLQELRGIISQTISSKTHKFFVFGSRVSGRARQYSDIDLGIQGPQPLNAAEYFALEEAFENSNLPYKIDLVDFAKVGEKFAKIALKNTLYLN